MPREFPNNLVYGYHGTTDAVATAILRQGFVPGPSRGDWLGRASYFFEDGERAALWARQLARRTGTSPVLIRAILDLSDCLDLTTLRGRKLLQDHAALVEQIMSPEEFANLKQTWGVRELDALMIDGVAATAVKPNGQPLFSTVRGCFTEGAPAFRVGDLTSGINELDHIQIAVLHSHAIEDVELTYL